MADDPDRAAASGSGAAAAAAASMPSDAAAVAASRSADAAAPAASSAAVGTAGERADERLVKMEPDEDAELVNNSVNVTAIAERAKRYADGLTSAADFGRFFDESLAQACLCVCV